MMRNERGLRSTLIATILLCATLALTGATQTHVIIMHTNDIHGRFKILVRDDSPILTEFAKGREEPQALRQRVRTMVQMINRGEIVYIAAPAYFPDRALHAVAKVDQFQSERLVIAFIPEMLDWRARLSAWDFRYAILITFAHEMIHLELTRERSAQSGKEAAKEEAVAWGKTVLEIIRPLEAEGLITIPEYLKLSSWLRTLNDNYVDPRWEKTFSCGEERTGTGDLGRYGLL